jgi:hypothetical protein
MTSTMTTTARLLLAALLIGTASMSWSASEKAENLAAGHARIATFSDTTADERNAAATRWTRWLQTALDSESIHDSATREYWHRQYEALTDTTTSRERDDPASFLITANATFREMQGEAIGRTLTVDELDRALQAYAGVLKNAGFDREAAWNYEYVARLRDAAAKEKFAGRQPGVKTGAALPVTTDVARSTAGSQVDAERRGGLPAGPTVHGRPGAHPPSTKGEEFEVITPMDYGDREAQPEPTPGVKLPRKG